MDNLNIETDVADDFLNNIGNEKQADPVSIPLPSVNIINPIVSQENITDSCPDLMGNEYPPEYIKIVERIKIQYRLLPCLDYDAIYSEIRELSIKSSPTPTLETLYDELYKVQAAKDRLAEILIDVIKCYNFKKRAIDILKDSWGKFTLEKNAEGRKGDAAFRMSHFMIDFSTTESLSKSCEHIFKNLDSLQDNLSRRITIWQSLLKLREGRMALPDYDFDKESGFKIDELFSDNKGENEENKNGENEIKLREF